MVADDGTPPDLLPPSTCTTTTAGDKSLNYLAPVVAKNFLRDSDTVRVDLAQLRASVISTVHATLSACARW